MNLPIYNFKCPQCGRTHVRPYNKATGSTSFVSTTSVGNSGLRVGTVGSDIRSVTMWMCLDCGHEFRDVNSWYQNLEPRYKKLKTLIALLIGGICGFPGLLLMLLSAPLGLTWIGVSAVCVWLLNKLFDSMKDKELKQITSLAERCSADSIRQN